VQNWFSQIQKWFARLFRKKRKYRSQIIKCIPNKTQDCSVLQLERDTPGAIATYRIVSKYSVRAYLLTLDLLTSVNSDMVGQFNGVAFRLHSSAYSRISAPTHRFAVFEIRTTGDAIPLHIWDVDLQGSASSIRGEMAATRAIAATALFPLLITDPLTWEWQMQNIDWLELLRQNIRAELGQQHQMKAREVLIELSGN
jgi:hypothetical protein